MAEDTNAPDFMGWLASEGINQRHPGFVVGNLERWLMQGEAAVIQAYGLGAKEVASQRLTSDYWSAWDGKLYHGTTAKAARRILADTLRPRSETGVSSNWEDPNLQPHPDHVYLSKCYAPYFAASAYANNGYSVYDKRIKWALIEVDTQRLDMLSLRPDEDLLAQVIHRTPDMIPKFVEQLGVKRMSLKEKSAWFRENIEHFSTEWRASLVALGHVSHKGAIPKQAITRIVLFQPDSNHHMVDFALDPSITPMNFQLVRDKYDTLTKWFMGEDVRPEGLTSSMSLAPSGDEYIEYLKSEVIPARGGLETIYESNSAPQSRDLGAILEVMQIMQLERLSVEGAPPTCFDRTAQGSSEPGVCNWLSSIWNKFAFERGVADDSKKYNPYSLNNALNFGTTVSANRPHYALEQESPSGGASPALDLAHSLGLLGFHPDTEE